MQKAAASFQLGVASTQLALLAKNPATSGHHARVKMLGAFLELPSSWFADHLLTESDEPDIARMTTGLYSTYGLIEARHGHRIAAAFKLGYSISAIAYFWRIPSANRSVITDEIKCAAKDAGISDDVTATLLAACIAPDANEDGVLSAVVRATEEISNALSTDAVFIVHGHDEAIREKVARFVERLGLTAIILHEQPNQGRTLIEKFISHSQVAFAVVLLTPDDIGGSKTANSKEYLPRARQNVVFELGYFVGLLGRDRVCALCVPTVDLPSDYVGTVYVKLDPDGAWKLSLAREMKSAGLNVSLDGVIA